MSLTIRRVVTGHDKNGRAIVSIDESVKNVVQTRPGAEAAVIWTSEGFPVDNNGSADASARNIGTATLDNGTVFRVVSFGPGVMGVAQVIRARHRYESVRVVENTSKAS